MTATFNKTSITLAPGASVPDGTATVTLSLSESGTTLVPADFTITATAAEAPEITLGTPGQLDLRPESLLVGSVVTNPAFSDPGGKVDVTAKIESVVNEPQNVAVSYVVTDANGNVLVPASTAVTVPLTITSGLTTVDLGSFDTTGFADGADTVTVTVTDPSSQARGVGHRSRQRDHRLAGDCEPLCQPSDPAAPGARRPQTRSRSTAPFPCPTR